MAITNLNWTGTNAPDIYTQSSITTTYIADLAGRDGGDYIELAAAVLDDSEIQGNKGGDNIVLTFSEISNSTVYGGAGDDLIEIYTQAGTDNQFWGDGGNDEIILGSRTFGAEYSFITIKADGLDPLKDGIDTVYIGENVQSFNQSSVDLGGNGNSLVGPIIGDVVEFFLNLSEDFNFDVSDLSGFGAELLIVEASEVFQSSFTGGTGVDIMALTPFGEDSTGFSESVLNGNEGTDVIAVVRDLQNSEILGGQDDDIILGLSGAITGTEINGNQGSDTVILLGLELNNATIYGGKAEDTILVAGVETINSLISGDLGNDVIDFLAAQSVETTLDGGDGDDIINDYSGALRTNGNYLSGGSGDDIITQASGVVFSEFANIYTTIDGGTGSDIMTGDSTTQTSTVEVLRLISGIVPIPPGPLSGLIAGIIDYGPKGYVENFVGTIPPLTLVSRDLQGLSRDDFSFAFGDSVINEEGVGADTITDFDSDASFYRNTADFGEDGFIPGSNSDPLDPFAYDRNGESFGGLDTLQRDIIELTDENGFDINITFGSSGTLDSDNTDYIVNGKGLVIDGILSLTEFIEAGGQQGEGEALLWTQNAKAYTDGPFGSLTPEYGILSYLFISDGTDGLSDGDLLVALDNVALTDGEGNVDASGGLEIRNGNITNIVTSFGITYDYPT